MSIESLSHYFAAVLSYLFVLVHFHIIYLALHCGSHDSCIVASLLIYPVVGNVNLSFLIVSSLETVVIINFPHR